MHMMAPKFFFRQAARADYFGGPRGRCMRACVVFDGFFWVTGVRRPAGVVYEVYRDLFSGVRRRRFRGVGSAVRIG